MHKTTPHLLALAALLTVGASAQAQQNVFKIGAIQYTTNSKTDGIQGAGVPPGADADTGDATTLLITYERLFTPSVGVELVIGVPPKIKARATGSVAFFGEVMSARVVAPTLIVNYHFGAEGDTFRPYLGAGVNYTKFTDVQSTLASDVKLADSTGLVLQAGFDYRFDARWGLFASVARVDTKSKLVAAGSTVLTTEIDFRPVTYSLGLSYKF